MNEDRRTSLFVGLFALVCLAVFAAAVLSLSAQRGFWVEQVRLVAFFDDVQGLIEGAPVRLAGKDVGIVEAVSFSEFGGDQAPVRVDMSIDPSAITRIRGDSVASIATIGLLGDKYIEVSLGTTGSAAVGEGGVLRSRTPLAIGDVVTKGTVALDEVAKLATSVNDLVGDLTDSMSASHIGETTAALADFTREVREGKGFFHSLIYDEYQGEGVASINRSLSTLERILTEVAEGDGLLHGLIYSTPEDEKALADIVSAAERINNILSKVDEGEGTLGLLVTDPTLYEDVKRLVDGAQRSVVIRSLIKLSNDAEGRGVEPVSAEAGGGGKRAWTLEGARAVFPDVRDRTARAADEVEALLEGLPEDAMEQDAALRARVERVVSRWMREMEALGADVKGLWLVDFDNGSGYYCWKHPEEELCHFHGYDEGFAGRARIQ